MKKHLFTLLAFGSLSLFTACGDDDEKKQDDPQPAKTALIAGKNWNLTKIHGTRNGTADPNINDNGAPACRKDDFIRFETGGVYKSDEGPTKCSAGDPQVISTGTWQLLNNDSDLQVSAGGQQMTFKLESISASELIYSYTETRQSDALKFFHTYKAL